MFQITIIRTLATGPAAAGPMVGRVHYFPQQYIYLT